MDRVELPVHFDVFFELLLADALFELLEGGVVVVEPDGRQTWRSSDEDGGLHPAIHRGKNRAPLRSVAVPDVRHTLGVNVRTREE